MHKIVKVIRGSHAFIYDPLVKLKVTSRGDLRQTDMISLLIYTGKASIQFDDFTMPI